MPQISKTLEYRRSRWLEENQNLEELVRQAWGQFDTQLDRTITQRDQRSTVGLQSRDFNANGFAVHCARYTDQQGVGTIPMAAARAAAVGERAPENGENFVNSDFIALIKGNHVICLSCGRNAGSLRIYLAALFQRAEMPDETRKFELIRIGSPDKIAMIHQSGVKRIDMNIGIAEAAAVALIDEPRGAGPWHGIKQNIADAFQAITARDTDSEQLRRAEKGTVTVSINVKKGDLLAAREGLNHFAEEVAEDEDAENFTIHLRDGRTTIRADEVAVRKQVRLESAANSVSVQEAWDAMEAYMNELTENGQLEA